MLSDFPAIGLQMVSDLLVIAASEPEGLAAIGTQFLLWTRVALGIGLVIFVHELGHFVAAKTFGVKCEKFYVGFDPPMKIGPIKIPSSLGKFKYGETEYGIGIIPLGGYVKMLGQDDDPRKLKQEAERARLAAEQGDDEQPGDVVEEASPELDPRSLPAKPVWQRMIIMSAGVFMNVVTGGMFAAAAFFFGVPYNPAIIGGVTPGGPAWQAAIQPGGQVVAVDGLTDTQMHFREMRSAIVHAGLEDPDRAIPLSVTYDESKRDYQLTTAPHPLRSSIRLIGITSPTSLTFSEKAHSAPFSAAEQVLTDADLGATIVSYNGIAVNESAIVPSTPFLDYLYTHPEDDIKLGLRRKDGSDHTVVLPTQSSRWFGVRLSVGEVSALVSGGPAERSGMKVGDVIESVVGLDDLDAESLLIFLARRQPIELTVRRGEESLTFELTPDDTPQSLPPTTDLSAEAAINAYGFAFRLPSVVAAFDESFLVEGDPMVPGDELQEMKLLPSNEFPPEFSESPLSLVVEQLQSGWKFDEASSGAAFLESIQVLPEGTKFKVLSKRADTGVIVESVVSLGADDRVRFSRGLGLLPAESVQTASTVSEATVLGIRECRRRLGEVLRFLKMLVRGQVGADQVGGPIRIFQVAGSEAEQGISKQLLFLTLLSMNLAVLNFLPIPVLDGGHMMFLTWELVMGRRVNEEIEMRLTLVGAFMLLALMVFVVFNDIINI